MKRHLVIIGFGQLGRACAQVIQNDDQCVLAGIVRRREALGEPLSKGLAEVPVVAHISELARVDAALVCVPPELVVGIACELLQHRIPLVECARLHGEAFLAHKAELDRVAARHKVAALVGAGWDPGVLSVLRSLFALLTPHGHTDQHHRPGINLHHTTVARAIPGVRAALSTELHDAAQHWQRYVYVELEQGADFSTVEAAVRQDPLFAGEDTQVFQVDSIATLEDEGHGIVLERRGQAANTEHQRLLFEGRFSETALAAQVMVAASHALIDHHSRAYGLLDLPLGALWGELRVAVEKAWM